MKNTKSKDRWTEIRFAYLCFDLYNKFRNFVILTDYIEFIAVMAGMEKAEGLRLLQRVTQINTLRPSNSEFICVARQNGLPIKRITDVLGISKKYYYLYVDEIDFTVIFHAQSSKQDLELMQKLLDAHQIFKDLGV